MMKASFKNVKLHFVGFVGNDDLTSLFQIKESIDYTKELDIRYILLYSL